MQVQVINGTCRCSMHKRSVSSSGQFEKAAISGYITDNSAILWIEKDGKKVGIELDEDFLNKIRATKTK